MKLDQAIKFQEQVCPCSLVLYFDVSDETMVKRLLKRGETSGRVDDNEETIRKRLDTFHKHVDPILNHCKEKLSRIPAERGIDEIFNDVCGAISKTVAS